jgi:hypothetical protein
MEHPSALAQTLSGDLERQYKDGRQLFELRGLPSEDRKHPCAQGRRLSLRLGLPDELRRLLSLFGEHPDVFEATPYERRRTPLSFRPMLYEHRGLLCELVGTLSKLLEHPSKYLG